MNNILGTTKISFEIEELLESAYQYLVFVSPYLKINQRLKVKLSDTFERVEKVFFLYRSGQVSKQELDWLQSFPNLTLYGLKDLHAKIYINQSSAIISSMNLYEYSQINNHEIGIKLRSPGQDFEDLLKEIRIMIQSEHDVTEFKNLKLITSDYLMGTLSANLTYHFKIIKPDTVWLSQHEWLSEKAMEIVDFNKDELYQDESAVLRSTDLGKERYELLERELRKLAN
jgi:hypothetical protein